MQNPYLILLIATALGMAWIILRDLIRESRNEDD
jgi:hypothetical protein